MVDMAELKKLDGKALQSKVEGLKKEIFSLKMRKATSGLEKIAELKSLKKDVARTLTVLNGQKARRK